MGTNLQILDSFHCSLMTLFLSFPRTEGNFIFLAIFLIQFGAFMWCFVYKSL